MVFGVNDRGIFRWDEGTLIPIALQAQSAPDGNGTFTFTIPSGDVFTPAASINSTGQVLFEAFLAGTADKYGIFVHDGNSLKQVFRASEAARPWLGTLAAFYAPLINDAGQVAFITDLQWAPIASGVFLYDGASLAEIASEGQPAPDGNGTFNQFAVRSLSDTGQLLFTASLLDTTGGNADDLGLYLDLGGGADVVQIARKGSQFDVGGGDLRTVSGIGWSELNNQDQLSLALSFTDGSSGVFLATIPEPASLSLLSLGAVGLFRRRRG